jgi:glycine/D-amino acid oxidase-like deaminating enzyme
MGQAGSVPRPPLPGDRRVDVAIVGGGYTGLWTAYYLKTLAPNLSVCILESHICGFGASGRNGGWLMAALAGENRILADLDGSRRQTAIGLILSILPEVESVLAKQGIDCDYRHGGGLFAAARYPEQLRLQREALAARLQCGFGEADYRWLDAQALSGRLRIRNALGAICTPHVARIEPARLASGLAVALEGLGVPLFEQTPVIGIEGETVHTTRGRVQATTRILAVEGYSYRLPGQRRHVLPVQSRIIATEPLDEGLWRDVGLAQHEVFCDASPLVTYGQRSADGRMVFGSRGAYRFGGRPRSGFAGDGEAFEAIHRLLLDCLPQLAGVPISHRWGGTLGIPRTGLPHAVYDPRSGLATAGGYSGEGVGASNLMARTLADLVLGRDTPLTAMPWAHRAAPERALRRWEPEPLRWLAYRATDLVMGWEESCYRRSGPAWQRALLRRCSAWLGAVRR